LALLSPAVPGLRVRYALAFTRVFPTEFGAIPFPLRERWMERGVRGLFGRPEVLGDAAISLAARDFIRVYRAPEARMAFFSSLRHVVMERPEPFWATMRRVKQPTLLLLGQADRLVPLRLGRRLAEHLPNVELLELPHVGHVPQFEAAQKTLDALLEFLPRVLD
jgi:pimeloyl-ACP methyl ester carboxylesterase